jgi:hypothetical protein
MPAGSKPTCATGSFSPARQELAKVWKIFRVNVHENPGGDVNHTTLTTLIDRQGNRRVDYYGDKWQDKEILKDINGCARKNRSSEGRIYGQSRTFRSCCAVDFTDGQARRSILYSFLAQCSLSFSPVTTSQHSRLKAIKAFGDPNQRSPRCDRRLRQAQHDDR